MYVDDHERRQIVMEKINFMTANKWQSAAAYIIHNHGGCWTAQSGQGRGYLRKINAIFRAEEKEEGVDTDRKNAGEEVVQEQNQFHIFFSWSSHHHHLHRPPPLLLVPSIALHSIDLKAEEEVHAANAKNMMGK